MNIFLGVRGFLLACHSFALGALADVSCSLHQDLFTIYDTNGDMCLDRSEFGPMMSAIGLQLSEHELNTLGA